MEVLLLIFLICTFGKGAIGYEDEFQNEFHRKCHEEENVNTIAQYFPYEIGINKIEEGFVCDNILLSKHDMIDIKLSNDILSPKEYIFLRNCEITYFNEYLLEKFPQSVGIYFENCSISIDYMVMYSIYTAPKNLNYISFHNCHFKNMVNEYAFLNTKPINLYLKNTEFDNSSISNINALPKFEEIIIDNANIEQYKKTMLSSVLHPIRKFVCTSCDLEEIDSILYELKTNIEDTISFADNRITKFPKDSNTTINLKNFILSHNNINESVLERSQFQNLKNLKFLDLSWNTEISTLSEFVFADTSLKVLNMSNVKLRNIEELGGEYLELIDLSYNMLTEIAGNTFKNCLKLRKLDLSHNQITNIDGQSFIHLKYLEYLFLEFNLIATISSETFSKLNNLKKLNLMCNLLEITDIHIEHFNSIEEVNLLGNIISKKDFDHLFEMFKNKLITEDNFDKKKCLDYQKYFTILNRTNAGTEVLENLTDSAFTAVDFSYNAISEVPENYFGQVKKLRTLILNNNKISKLDFYLPSSLEVLNLAANNISEENLNVTVFKTLKNVHTLALSRNTKISTVEAMTFKETSLRILNMSYVNLENIEELGSPYLEILDLSNNNICKLDKALKGLKKLKKLDLRSNYIDFLLSNTFVDTKDLIELDLSNNNLQNVNSLALPVNPEFLKYLISAVKDISYHSIFPSTLQYLNISNNPMIFVGKNTFENMENLLHLDITNINNTFVYFDKQCLKPLRKLKTLNMAFNGISTLEEIFLPDALENLDLGFNEISAISNNTFNRFINLKFLNISNNNIETINVDAFRKLTCNLKTLDMIGNKPLIIN